MAKIEFLQNVRRARNFFAHRVRATVPESDPTTVESQLERGALWLTPSSVKGFRKREFSELDPETLDRLSNAVERFREIAASVRPTEPAPEHETREAMQCLTEILAILDGYLVSGPDEERVRQVIEQLDLPQVVQWDAEVRLDSTGDPSVKIWFFVDPELPDRPEFSDVTTEVRERVHRGLREAELELWPYVHFRTTAEQRAL